MTQTDLFTLLPLVVLAGWAVLLLLADLWIPSDRKGITAFLAGLGLLVTLWLVVSRAGTVTEAFSGSVRMDGLAVFMNVVFLVSGLAGITLAYNYLKRMGWERSEYYVLLLVTICGMMLMSYANDLIVVFIALELLSIPLYILAGFIRHDKASEEAALKYFLLGTFSSGFVLYGVALVFGSNGHTGFSAVMAAVTAGTANTTLLITGAAMLLVGFSFKAALVPFHMWSPDVYQGSPSSVTAFMSVGAKAAGFVALARVFVLAFPAVSDALMPLLWGVAALTMVVGNIAALNQKNIKRLLAYSSIAQSGYILMAFVPFGNPAVRTDALASLLFYLAAYGLTTFAAWAVVIALEKAEGKALELDDYAGLGKKYPMYAIVMLIAMLSFTGMPLTAGFWGKLYLFTAAVQGGQWLLAIIGLLASIISAYYYLRVIVIMYMRPGAPQVKRNWLLEATAFISALAVVALGFIPWVLLDIAGRMAALM
ncbi:MAG: NADH-quinone oxidoreductase subunit N [Anaerolineae bacterium]|nr:NADH-quinone oxidoreductase subunit N [Anaerolineae bacterium]